MSVTVNTTSGTQVSVSVNGTNVVSFLTEETSVNVTDGDAVSITVSEKGPKGDAGETGAAGAGFSQGGAENQFIQKNSAADYDTKWSAYTLPAADGDDNQVLVTDGAGTLTFDHVRSTRITIRNDEGATIPAGTPVYSKGEVGGSERILVGIADASDPAKMPAIGIAETTLNTTSSQDGYAIMSGIFNTNVSGFTGLSEGDILYVSNSGGGLSQTKPTGTYLIQNIGIVLKTNGTILQGFQVSCIGRTNDVPNIATGNIWAGNASGVATATDTAYIDIANSRVGIGTSSPSTKLEVNGGVTASGPIESSDGTNTSLTSETARFNKFGLMANRSSLYITNENASGSMQFGIGGVHAAATKMYLSSAGKVGIGTTSPASPLHIYQNDALTGTPSGITIEQNGTGDAVLQFLLTAAKRWVVGIDNNNNDNFKISGTADLGTDNGLTITNSTYNVGIGTTSPSAKLDVVGLANINDGSDNVMISSGNTALTTGTNNTAVGYQAGYSNTTGSNNIAIGRNAGYHATGSNNALVGYYAGHGASGASTFSNAVALGYQALQSLTTGSSNTGLGYRALASNLTGGNNTAVGNIAGVNITGGNNTVMGFAAGQDITSGSNTAMGWRAGEDVGSDNTMVGREAGRFTTSSNNVAIGSYAAKGVQATSTFSNTVAVGYQALTALTTGISNTSVGHQALTNVTTASSNTAVGYNAGFATISNGSNSFVGAYAGANSTGSSNTAVGFGANYYNTTGSNNVAIGRAAAYGASGASTFSNTVAVGYQALTALTTGAQNTAIGYQAADELTTESSNTVIGYQALGAATSVENATGVGYKALDVSTGNYTAALGFRSGQNSGFGSVTMGSFSGQYATGDSNVLIGYAAGQGSSGASTFVDTTAVGHEALQDLTSGAGNTAVGYKASTSVTTGSNNTTFGYQAGYTNSTGSGNIFIGYQAGYNETGSNKLYIANSNTATPLIYGEFDNEIVNVNGKLKPNSVTIDDEGLSAAGDYGPGAEIWYQGTSTPSAGYCYYLDSTGGWTAAQANASGTATGMLAVSAGTDSDVDGMVLRGFVQIGNTLTGSVGDAVYLSESSSGRFTTTKPTGAGNFVRRVGYLAKGTNVIYFNPSPEWEAL